MIPIAGTYKPSKLPDEAVEKIQRIHKNLFGEELPPGQLPPDLIITTDKMTPEERKFEIIAQLIRNGATLEEANRKYEELVEAARMFGIEMEKETKQGE